MSCNFYWKNVLKPDLARGRHSLLAGLCALLLCSGPLNAQNSAQNSAQTPAPGLPGGSEAVAAEARWAKDYPQLRQLGSGDLRWFGFHIYSARLFAEQTPFSTQNLFALELTYRRAITRDRFVQVSLDEMRRLQGEKISQAKLEEWQAALQRAFVDVKEGDQLTGVYLPGIGCRFYSRHTLLAEIRDPALAQAFFSIWFDARSKDQNLRKKLTQTAQS